MSGKAKNKKNFTRGPKDGEDQNLLNPTREESPPIPESPEPPKPTSTLDILLLDIKRDNKKNAQVTNAKLRNLDTKMDNNQSSLSEKIMLSNNNLKKMMEEQSVIFCKDIDRFNETLAT